MPCRVAGNGFNPARLVATRRHHVNRSRRRNALRPGTCVGAILFSVGLASLLQQARWRRDAAVLFHRFGGQQPTTPAFGFGGTERTPSRIQNTPARSTPLKGTRTTRNLPEPSPSAPQVPGPWHDGTHGTHGSRPLAAAELRHRKAPIPEHLQGNIGVFDHFRLGNFGISQPIADFRAK